MKTKSYAMILCLSFALLITASGIVHAQGNWGGSGYMQGLGDYSYMVIGSGAATYGSMTGLVIAGSLAHRSGDSYTGTYGQKDPQDSWGMQIIGYYSPDFYLNPLKGLENYMQGLQFGSIGSNLAASGFPAFSGNTYNLSIPSMGTQPPGMNLPSGMRNPTELAIPWQGVFEEFVPGYNYDPTKLEITSPIITDIGPGGAGHVPGQIWGLSARPQWDFSLMYY